MLKNRIVLVAVAIMLLSCQKETLYSSDARKAQLTIDSTIIEKYITDNKITGVKQGQYKGRGNGLFYKILNPGVADPTPVGLNDTLSLFYDGRILGNRLAFDSVSTITPRIFILGNTIEGWQKGIPLINLGGKIRLIIPSTMAYINRRVGPIPANSILDFSIILDSVKHEQIKNN